MSSENDTIIAIANNLAALHFTSVHGRVERMISVHSKCSKSLYCWCVDGVMCVGVGGGSDECVCVCVCVVLLHLWERA